MDNEFKSFFKNVGGNEGDKCKYPVRLDTYGKGCSHDCSYCYAKSLLDFRKLWNPTDPSLADVTKIRKQIDKIASGKCGNIRAIRLGGDDRLLPAHRRNTPRNIRNIEVSQGKAGAIPHSHQVRLGGNG